MNTPSAPRSAAQLDALCATLGARAGVHFTRSSVLLPVRFWTDGADPIDDPDDLIDLVRAVRPRIEAAEGAPILYQVGSLDGGIVIALAGGPLSDRDVQAFLFMTPPLDLMTRWLAA